MVVLGFWQIGLIFILLLGLILLVGVGALVGYLATRKRHEPPVVQADQPADRPANQLLKAKVDRTDVNDDGLSDD